MIYIYKNLNKLKLSTYIKLLTNLPKEMQEKANEKKTQTDKNIFVFEYNKLKQLLKVDLNAMKYSKQGKPYFENSGKYFSISHSSNTLCIAVENENVGIDIESIMKFDEMVARQICNDKEYLKISTAKNKNLAFTKMWVKKESLIKCKAEGFNQDLKTIFERNPAYKFKFYKQKNYVIYKCVKY